MNAALPSPRKPLRRLAPALAAALLGAPLGAQLVPIPEEALLLPSDGGPNDAFGRSVSIAGDLALVGADGQSIALGAAYVFERTPAGWLEQQKLLAAEGSQGDLFGWSVSTDGIRALVGAPGDGGAQPTNAGSAYVFVKTPGGWVEEAKLAASDGLAFDELGTSVALDGDRALLGCPGCDQAGAQAGAAYVFERGPGGWVEVQKLQPLDAAAGDDFGLSVALSGDLALVGASGKKVSPIFFQPSAYVFERTASGWVQQAKLPDPEAASGELGSEFGQAVSLAGERALIGAPGDKLGSATDAGSAFVYEHTPSGWALQAKLLPPEGAVPGDRFGLALAIDGNLAVVATSVADEAFVFERSAGGAWEAKAKLSPTQFKGFGNSVALSGDRPLLGGSVLQPPGGFTVGAAFAFHAPASGCTFRAGTLGLNPADYACTTEPQIGTTWLASVSTAPLLGTATASTVLALGFGGPTQGLAVVGFELLILPPYSALNVSSTGVHAIPVPVEPTIVGAAVASQAGRVETSGPSVFVVLTNAQDLVVGLY